MVSFEEAYQSILEHPLNIGEVEVPLEKAHGRILAEPVYADLDFPPFDRATKDGVAINYKAIESRTAQLKIEGTAAAGTPQMTLGDTHNCIEIMTGAMLPKNTDTVVMYEHITIADGMVVLDKPVRKGQNIHGKGSDEPLGAEVLRLGIRLTAAEIGVLASVGKSKIKVKKSPSICLVATGDELVNVDQIPNPYQIRKSNSHTLRAALLDRGIGSISIHIADDKKATEHAISNAMESHDVLLLSGGVSKGKYDYLPEVFNSLGVQQLFHKVRQRPGKPFWFGKHKTTNTTLFAFPGNPASTFANYHAYFIPWLHTSLGIPNTEIQVILDEAFENQTDLTRFIRVKVTIEQGRLLAKFVHGNGSGDLTSLTKADGFVRLAPYQKYDVGHAVPFMATRKLI